MKRTMQLTGCVLASLAVLAACDQSPTAVPANDFGFAAALVAPDVAAGDVIVCKDSPSGTFNFTLTNVANFTTAVGSPFQIDATAANPCVTVGNAPGQLGTLTVTELADPAYTFEQVDVYRFQSTPTEQSGTPTLVSTDTNNPFANVTPNNDQGFVIVFTNAEVPVVSLPGRMTGGGSVFMGDVRFTHGFELHCDVNDLPNNLEVNWPDNRFHLTALTSVVCTDDPALHPLPRRAGFDTYTASGVGLWNGQPGATIDFVFTDDGEPGRKDLATMTITPPGGSPVTVTGYLEKGNHQAHWVN